VASAYAGRDTAAGTLMGRERVGSLAAGMGSISLQEKG